MRYRRFARRSARQGYILEPMMLSTVEVGMPGKCEMKSGQAGEETNPEGEHCHQHQVSGGRDVDLLAIASTHV